MEQNLYNLQEKFNVFMNIEKEDKDRFKAILAWTSEMLELTVKEKYSKSIQVLRAEVWTCQFGENIGSEINKVRPVLIISSDIGNAMSPTVTVIPITSKEARQVTHIELLEEDLIYVENSLKGTITAEGMRNVSKARLGRKIAKLSDDCMVRVEEAIMKSLGFSNRMQEEILHPPLAEHVS